MSEDQKAKSIPEWQKRQAPPEDTKSTSPSEPTTPPLTATIVHESGGAPKDEEHETTGHSFSIEEVKRFLGDPGVRDAPEEKKRSFLVAKGVDASTIDEILRKQAPQKNVEQSTHFDVTEFTTQEQQRSRSSQVRETAPIVTYPEFLIKPQKPPPLVTVGRLLNTAYVAGGFAATFYGLSKYIIEPMTANLAESRHEFAQHSREQVQALNERLEKVVSRIPPPKVAAGGANLEAGSEVDSVTSDPTELFHRDIGVQTSPPLSRRSSMVTAQPLDPAMTKTTTDKHEERLRIMRTRLDDILDGEVSSRESNGKLETSVSELREYLNGLFFAPSRHVEYGVWQSRDPEDKKDDAVAAFRNEIRGVKGMLLSARRFPASKPAVRVGS